MRHAVRWALLNVSSLCAATIAGRCTVRLDPAAGTAEVVEWEPGTPLSPVSYEMVLPDGEIAKGVWDVNPRDRDGPWLGVRAKALVIDCDTGEPIVLSTAIRLGIRQPHRAGPGVSRRVDASLLSDPAAGDTEPAWYLCFQTMQHIIGTVPSDGDACTMHIFTRFADGSIVEGGWGENTLDQDATLSQLLPLATQMSLLAA